MPQIRARPPGQRARLHLGSVALRAAVVEDEELQGIVAEPQQVVALEVVVELKATPERRKQQQRGQQARCHRQPLVPKQSGGQIESLPHAGSL